MKIKKVLILMIILVTCSARWPTVASGQQQKELSQNVKELQEKIKELEKTIKAQQQILFQAKKACEHVKKQLDEQIKENERLKILCEQAGINTARIADASFYPSDIVYRGKKRTQKWFERMYERFSDKIICIDGKYIDEIKKKVIYLQGEASYPKGTIVAIPNRRWNVLQALGNGEALIMQKGMGVSSSRFSYREPDALFHLSGYQGQLTDNQSISLKGYLISTGTYEYTTALGAKKTVQSFVLYQHQQLTREQFADAITSGFKLVDYKKVGEKTVERPIR